MKKYWFFDVFDTLITRRVGSPEHVFLLVASRIEADTRLGLDPIIFARQRVQAERHLLKTATIPNIREIYAELAKRLGLSASLAHKFLATEIALEYEQSLPINSGIALVKEARKKGYGVVYISDMYLNTEHIRSLLEKHNIVRNGENIFVSCEYRQSKQGGELFRTAMEKLGLASADIHHYGNCRSRDVMGPKRAGIASTFLPNSNLNRYERTLASAGARHPVGWNDALRYSTMAAASRYARITGTYRNRDIHDIACSVAGPVLYNFVASVLRNHPRKTIWFLSRDGYVLYRIAQKLRDHFQPDADLRYLYISREVLTLASLPDIDEAKWVPSLRKIYSPCTLFQMMTGMGMDKWVQGALAIIPSLLERDISEIDEDQLLAILKADEVRDKLKVIAKQRRANLVGYLRQEGLLPRGKQVRGQAECSTREWNNADADAAETETAGTGEGPRNSAGLGAPQHSHLLVDVGWNLTIQDLLATVCRQEGITAPDGFYLGISDANAFLSNGSKEGFLWDQRKGLRGTGSDFNSNKGLLSGEAAASFVARLPGATPSPLPRVTRIIEAFCSAPHGQTIDYTESHGRYEPVLNDYDTEALRSWGIADAEAGILRFAEAMLELGPEPNDGADHGTPEDHRDHVTDSGHRFRHSHIGNLGCKCKFDRLVYMQLIDEFWLHPSRQEIKIWGKYPFFVTRDGKQATTLYQDVPFSKTVFSIMRHGRPAAGTSNSWPNAVLHTGHSLRNRILQTILRFRNALR